MCEEVQCNIGIASGNLRFLELQETLLEGIESVG